MAIMFPNKPKEFSYSSREGMMFSELERLSDDYYVFHSFSILEVVNNTIHESETDFVIFHPKKGILCIEAKAGRVEYSKGEWRYGSGRLMSHDGPFQQASKNKWKLLELMRNKKYDQIVNRCKFLHAVWFPDVPLRAFDTVALPSDTDKSLMLTSDSFGNIEKDISRIYKIKLPNGKETSLNDKEAKLIINNILAPNFNLVSLAGFKKERHQLVFKRLLREQVALLNYLDEQRSAIINGLAGTGKTILAIEKAKRHASKGQPVLFLCYNLNLKEYLKEMYSDPNISFYTIDGLACKMCNTKTPDYERFKTVLEDCYSNMNFPYRHIVIDEGQDFGRDSIEEVAIIDRLKMNVLESDDEEGTFYLFYDKNQMIQSSNVPSYIEDADCKLTLYRNCRNTENVAITSLRLLGRKYKIQLFEDSIQGDVPEMFFCNAITDTIDATNAAIKDLLEQDYTDIVILTCKTEQTSNLSDHCSNGVYHYKKFKFKFTTCRKFKGLEADAIILVDLDDSMFSNNKEQIMYVGASRARFKLTCIANMTEESCKALLERSNVNISKNIMKSFATAYNAKNTIVSKVQ
ncbi:hypothetical protein AOC36_06910 [Erysipelothrix larvae]|uniref:DNA helicase n=1 Tax=Erysipelothrix larvae TaxID=1514105 RepID=A0A109UH60_9FIRM|nr:ATP-binding domain-containing protein [Erysipelothrix larvae]AMC93721.1 hypothetical protein AOC36_06910 [Erysipelothrix larvae]